MSACFHIPGVQCDNCRTGLKDDRPYVATVTTGGTYYSSQDFLAALRQVEIERDDYKRRWEAEVKDGQEGARERDALRSILTEIYEGQPAACVGPVARVNPVPCKTCIWCRVRAILYYSLRDLIHEQVHR